jgi:uncharacterized glyoxalase superfamily protein PhnB
MAAVADRACPVEEDGVGSEEPSDPQAVFVGMHLTVEDMDASLAFYRRLGLSVPDLEPGGTHVEINVGGVIFVSLSTVELTVSYDPGYRPRNLPPGSVMQFHLAGVGGVDRLYADMTAAGYHGHLAPFDAFWGNRYAEIDDPDGNVVGIHGPLGPA